jgi:murein DD-endopeptidase MepM/ murein hydrolase activator NlpD
MFASSVHKKTSLFRFAKLFSLLLFIAVVSAGMAGNIGYKLGFKNANLPESDSEIAALRALLVTERENLQQVKDKTEDDLDALAIKLGAMQAKLMRLEAIGERLVTVVDIDIDKEDFKQDPAMGDASDGESGHTHAAVDLLESIDLLDRQLASQDMHLSTLEKALMERGVNEEVVPSGMPVKGYISSGFGGRIHPISGKYKGHEGVDIPGKVGTKIKAVAGGIVVDSKWVGGYGNMVEVKHADGYTTRYAHNQKNIVKVGEVIEKGDVVALLGNTGRSTGPHVHFEVRKHGNPINPMRFINNIN